MSKSMVLRVCRADMSSFNGFIWPTAGHVVAPDWKATQECGNGLHGWFEGQGYAGCSDYHSKADAKYLVLEVETDSIVHLEGKCKFPEADVVFVGNRSEAMTYIWKSYPQLRAMPLLFANRTAGENGIATAGDYGTATADYGTATAGDYGTATAGNCGTTTVGKCGTATAGDYGTATAGDYGTATAGNRGTARVSNYGTATAGDYGTATAGNRGTATAGDDSTATAGNSGTATAGKRGTATAGNRGTARAGENGIATAGENGTATAGDYGTATAGDYGIATAGNGGTATAGVEGVIQIHYFNDKVRFVTGYIGEKGLSPNVKYKLDANHNFVEVT